MENKKYYGINGQIAEITENFSDVVCEEGVLRVYEYNNIDGVKMIVGHKFI